MNTGGLAESGKALVLKTSDRESVRGFESSTLRLQLRADVLAILPDWARDSVVLMGIRGSHAHGTYIPPAHEYGTDDVDVFVVTVQPVDWYLGLDSYRLGGKLGRHAEITSGPLDVVVYDVRKFCWLLAKGNPNVHAWLWAPEDCYLDTPRAGMMMIADRRAFLSQRVLVATAGYAAGQLHRMTHFRRDGYMGAKRKALVERHGYDVKNAAHCMRLLMQGKELADHGHVRVRWEGAEAKILKEIKLGKWTLTGVRELAEWMFSQFNEAREASGLPVDVDRAVCNRIVCDVIRDAAKQREESV